MGGANVAGGGNYLGGNEGDDNSKTLMRPMPRTFSVGFNSKIFMRPLCSLCLCGGFSVFVNHHGRTEDAKDAQRTGVIAPPFQFQQPIARAKLYRVCRLRLVSPLTAPASFGCCRKRWVAVSGDTN